MFLFGLFHMLVKIYSKGFYVFEQLGELVIRHTHIISPLTQQ